MSDDTKIATFSRPRIAWHPAIQERFDVDQAGWRALIDAIWPAAKSADAVVLALSYCKARKLDPFKRPVHIVPVWSREQKRMIESVWPGIGELRTTAFRTGLYAGRDKPEYGPTINANLGGVEITYPEWCEITAYRLGRNGERMPYPGPRVYWMESYATASHDTMAPNGMWRRRPYGQIEKCAEAAALRAAFPEELGNEYAAEEMSGQMIEHEPPAPPPLIESKQSNLDKFEDRHAKAEPEAPAESVNQALYVAGDQMAQQGTEALEAWWLSLTSSQRGYLGAKGRSRGPHYTAWAERAAQEPGLHGGADEDAAEPQTVGRPAQSADDRRGAAEVEGGDRAPSAPLPPTTDLLGG